MDIETLDTQIAQIQGYYLDDTKETGNLLRGFDNYLITRTAQRSTVTTHPSRNQTVQLKQRLFSLSSIRSKISQRWEQERQKSLLGMDTSLASDIGFGSNTISKRNRHRANPDKKFVTGTNSNGGSGVGKSASTIGHSGKLTHSGGGMMMGQGKVYESEDESISTPMNLDAGNSRGQDSMIKGRGSEKKKRIAKRSSNVRKPT